MGGLTRMMGKASAELRRKQAGQNRRPTSTGVANAKTRGKASVGLARSRKPALTGINNAMTRGKASVGLAHKRPKPSSIAANRSPGGYSKLGQMFSSVKKKKRKKRRRLLG